MEDKGEKIIFLAREILESDATPAPVTKKTMSITMTFKTLCFTTLLAAASGDLISTYVHEQGRPLNRYERVELQALVFYTARTKNISEDILRTEVEKQVGIERFDDMTAKEFSAARLYLQEKAQ
jgi:hypothetical protein